MQYHYTLLDAELGQLGLVKSATGLVRIIIDTTKAAVLESIHTVYPDAVESIETFGDLQSRLVRYLDGERVAFDDGIDLSALTGFRREVLEAARNIPYGEVRSYGWLAQQVGRPRAARAVGQAIAAALEGRDAVVIASTDMTHYQSPATARQQDALLIRRIEALDPEGLIAERDARRISMCGAGPVAATLVAAEALGATNVESLSYSTSGDVMPSDQVVGYYAAAIRR